MRKETNYLACMLFGAAAGFVVGIMLAPDKGCNTREKIKDKLKDYKDKAEDLVDDLKYEGESLMKKGKNYVKKQKEKLGEELMEEDDSFI